MADVVYTVEINGVERDVLLTTIDLRMTSDGVPTLNFDLDSEDASYRPDLDDTVELFENGTPKFKGFITSAREESHGGPALDSIVTRCSAAGQDVILTYRYLTITIAAGSTLKQALQQIDADPENYFSGWGITLAAGQANGPTLDADVTFTRVRLDEAIKRLAELTGYIPEVSANDEFEMYAPGSRSAPGNLLATGDVHQVGDVLIEPTRDDTFVNRIILVVTGAGPAQSTETITFDGNAVFTYTAKYPAPIDANTTWPNVIYLASAGGDRGGPIGFNDGSSAWEWVTAVGQRARLELNGAGLVPANGDTFTITYDIAYPFDVVVEALGSPPSRIREIVLQQPEGMTLEEATAWAESLLNRKNTTLKTARFQSHTLGWAPGQTLTINLPKRNVNATFLIQEVVMRPDTGGWFKTDDGDERLMRYEITAVEGDVNQGDWRNTPRSWLGDGNEGSLQTSGAGARPGGDVRDVQVHGASHDFYGDETVLHDFDGGGDHYDFTGDDLPAKLAAGSTDDSQFMFALWNAVAGKDKAATFHKEDNGAFTFKDYPGSAPAITKFQSYRQLQLLGATGVQIQAGTSFGRTSALVTGVLSTEGFGLGVRRVTSLPFSIDATDTSGTASVYLFDGLSGSGTCNLPSLSSQWVTLGGGLLTGTSDFYRILTIRNDDPTYSVTLDPSSTQLINGASTLVLGPGQAVILIGWNGTSAGWRTLATNGTGSPAGSDSYVQYNNSGAFGGDAAFVFDDTEKQLTIETPTGANRQALKVMQGGTSQGAIVMRPTDADYEEIDFSMEYVSNVLKARSTNPGYVFHSGSAPYIGMEIIRDETIGNTVTSAKGIGFNIETSPWKFKVYEYGGFGTGAIPGMGVHVTRNSSGGGAAAWIALEDKGGTPYYLWVEGGKLRIHTSPPTEDNTTVSHTAGTVVGSQS